MWQNPANFSLPFNPCSLELIKLRGSILAPYPWHFTATAVRLSEKSRREWQMLDSTLVTTSSALQSGAATTASLWHATTTTAANAYAFTAAFANHKYAKSGTWGIIG
jgi:hypothetical protein